MKVHKIKNIWDSLERPLNPDSKLVIEYKNRVPIRCYWEYESVNKIMIDESI